MKSFKFTGISILFRRVADYPRWDEGQRFVLKHQEDLDRPKQADSDK